MPVCAVLCHGTESILHLDNLGIAQSGGEALGASMVDIAAASGGDLLGLLLAHVLGGISAEGGDVGRH